MQSASVRDPSRLRGDDGRDVGVNAIPRLAMRAKKRTRLLSKLLFASDFDNETTKKVNDT